MDICKAYGLAPFFAVILEGIAVPAKDVADREDIIKQWFDKIVPEGYSCYEIIHPLVRW